VLPASLQLGPVHLYVRDRARAVEWYRTALGLDLDERDDVVVLHEDPEARPGGRHAGLYHYALLYPSREALARVVIRLAETSTPIQGASDHETHEAIYLPDADGNGIELAADRPREQWPDGLGYGGGPKPLDVRALLATVESAPDGRDLAEGLRVGHMHLHVGDVAEGIAFYCDVIGFELQANLGTAAFVSAGGYHHHLGFNVWQGQGVGPAPPHTAGLEHWTIELPSDEDVAAVRQRVEASGRRVEPADGGFLVRDPWDIPLLVARS
jgi:catechol 2,3-dioxygenase